MDQWGSDKRGSTVIQIFKVSQKGLSCRFAICHKHIYSYIASYLKSIRLPYPQCTAS